MADTDGSPRVVREIFLAGFMSGMPPENVAWAAARLAKTMEDVHLVAGDVLYRQGEATTSHYFVVYGEMKLEADGVPPWVLGDRSLVGTIDLTLDRPRTRTATATRDTHLLRMPAEDWLDMLEDNFELMLRGVHGLADGVHALRVEIDDFGPGKSGPPAAYVCPATGPIGLIERILILRGVPLFAKGEMQALTNLAEVAHEASFAAGDLLFEPGEACDSMFVVVSGEVMASHARATHPDKHGPGMLVAGSAAASSKDLGIEARATMATRALRILREDYFDVMEEHFTLARSSMKALAAEREILVNAKGRRGGP
jgi:CRP-like cAMP-binding protein